MVLEIMGRRETRRVRGGHYNITSVDSIMSEQLASNDASCQPARWGAARAEKAPFFWIAPVLEGAELELEETALDPEDEVGLAAELEAEL